MKVTVASLQLPPCGMDLSINRATAEAYVREAAAAGARLIALPELATLPYFCGGPPDAYRHWAEPSDGPLAGYFASLARELAVTLVVPFYEYDPASGHYHNAVLAFGADGRALAKGPVARKLHLPRGDDPPPGYDEKAHFTPGSSLSVIEAEGLTFGVLVCYDRRFPEAWRALRAKGAELVIVPVAGTGGDDMDFFIGELRTHARENGLAVLCANKVGFEVIEGGVVDNYGYSSVIQADGTLIALRDRVAGPGILLAELDPDAISSIRRKLTYFADRRTDLF